MSKAPIDATALRVTVTLGCHELQAGHALINSRVAPFCLVNQPFTFPTMDMSANSSMSSDSSSVSGGMDMSGSSGMMMYLHFTGGDYLFFKGVAPSSGGALAGASLVLVLLAIFERALYAGRVLLEAHWRQAYVVCLYNSDIPA